MAGELAKAYVQIIPSADGIAGQLSSIMSQEADSAGSNSGALFGSKFKLAAVASVAAAAAGIATAVKGVWDQVNATASAGDTIDKTSQKIGVAASEYQTMAYAAEHCGFSVNTFETAAKALNNTDFDGNVWDAVEAIQAIEDPAERAAKAQELLGARSAQEMAALINGTQTLDDYKSSLEALGGMMSDETVAASAAFEDAMTDLNTSLTGMKNSFAEEFLPSCTDVINGLALMISGDEGGLALVQTGISDMMNNLIESLPGMIDSATQLVSTFIDTIIQNLPQLIEMGITLIAKLIVGLVQAIPDIVAAIPDIVKAIWDGVSSIDWIQLGIDVVDGIIDGLKSCITKLGSAMKDVASSALESAKNVLGIHSPSRVFKMQVGEMIDEGIAEGIESNTAAVTGAMTALSDATANNYSADFVPANYENLSNDNVINAIYAIANQIVNTINSQDYGSNVYIGDRDIVNAYDRGKRLMGHSLVEV